LGYREKMREERMLFVVRERCLHVCFELAKDKVLKFVDKYVQVRKGKLVID
jgi:hypothetical protein